MRRFYLWIFCLYGIVANAQNLNFIKYNTNNSKLPHDIIYEIRQGKDGYLWICTDDGLVKFDGMQMTNVGNGLLSNYVISTAEENGHTWACTWRGGIHVMENDSFVVYSNALWQVESFNKILAFDNLLIAYCFDDYVVYRIDTIRKTLLPVELKSGTKHSKSDWTRYFVTPSDSEYYRFLKTTGRRMLAYNKTGIYEVVQGKLRLATSAIQPDEIWERPDGKLFYRTGTKVYSCNRYFGSSVLLYDFPAERFADQKIFSFQVLPSGNVCFGMVKAAVGKTFLLANPRTGEILDLIVEVNSESPASFLTTDSEGGLWMSTDGDGVYHIFDRKYYLIGIDWLFKSTTITDMYKYKDGQLYIGTKLSVYTYSQNTLKLNEDITKIPGLFIHSFFLTEDGKLAASNKNWNISGSYVVSEKGIQKLSYIHRTVLKDYEVISRLGHYEINWTDSSGGRSKKVAKTYKIRVNSMDQGDDHILLLGGIDGLYTFSPAAGLRKDSLMGNFSINKILYQKNTGLWVATKNGLYLYQAGTLKRWGLEQGLTNLNIIDLYLQSPNSLWIGTQNGLFNLKNGRITSYKKRNGLIADDVSCLEPTSPDILAVGSSKGITFLYMNEPKPEQKAPELLMEKILVNGEEFSGNKEVHVPFNSTFSFAYNAITFVYPELVSFEYRMKTDDPWIKTQNKSLVFTNLEPGKYDFQIRVKKFDSDYGAAVTFPIHIALPWWRTWYFYGGILLCLISLTYFILNRRLAKQKELAKTRQQLSELKLKALQAQLNPHFISNSLNTIQYYSLKQDEISANQYLTQFADLTRLVLETSRTRFILLSTELEILKLYLNLEKLRFENKFEFHIEVDPSLNPDSIYIPGMLIQPFAENSVNHGIGYLPPGKTGILLISMSQQEEYLRIEIDDNGIGRAKASEIKSRLKKVYRSVSTEIVEELRETVNDMPGNRIEIETLDKYDSENLPAGTKVILLIKIDAAF